MSKKWYTSDFHLFHHNIIKYCNRPFDNVFDMHETIIERMNERVAPNDNLYILGDVSFYGGDKVIDILNRIKGKKHFIIGNHDAKNMKKWDGWESVSHYLEIRDNGKHVVLCHYPIESWHGQNHGWIHLHGHRHGVCSRYEGKTPDRGIRCDIGVDPWGFYPVSLYEVLKEREE